jgi:two-component system sensor histidine kinase and response regulator WspE
MSQDNDNQGGGDLSQFSMLDLFRMEADSQTQILTEGLLAMERIKGDASAVESMMRAAHSIKGAAAIVGLEVVVQLAHGMEDAFIAAQHGKLALTPNRVDVLLAGVDLILQASRLQDSGVEAWLAANGGQITRTLDSIATIAFLPEPVSPQVETEPPQTSFPSPAPDDAPATASRLPAMKHAQNFDKLLSLASESRINAHQMHPFIQDMQRFKRSQSSLFSLIEQLHEAISNGSDASLKEKSLLALQKSHPLKQFVLEHIADIEAYERRLLAVSQGMVDEVLTLRMCPFGDGVHGLPRMVRDLARSLGKDVRLQIVGEDTLVDRDMLAAPRSKPAQPAAAQRGRPRHGNAGRARWPPASRSAGTIRLKRATAAACCRSKSATTAAASIWKKSASAVVARKLASAQMARRLSQRRADGVPVPARLQR